MPNPFFTAGDAGVGSRHQPRRLRGEALLRPERRTTLFGNFAQTLYAENNPDSTSNNLGFNFADDAICSATRSASSYKFKQDMSLKAAATYYQL